MALGGGGQKPNSHRPLRNYRFEIDGFPNFPKYSQAEYVGHFILFSKKFLAS